MDKLSDLKQLHIAHTDAGDFLAYKGGAEKEFYVQATIKNKRAGLFFLDIEGERYSCKAKMGFTPGQDVRALIEAHIQGHEVTFTVKTVETL
jgi:hypothetical protein